MEVEVTFLSPIEPADLVRQSFPFTYMYLTANATDGANHSVQLYSDISAEWVSGDSGNEVTWSTTPGDDLVFHQAQMASPSPMQEFNDQAEDATIYYAMANSPNMTWQTGVDIIVRGQFAGNRTGGLLNTKDTNFRAISNNWPVFGLALDLGNISEVSTPVVWALGVVRDPVISYGSGGGKIQPRSSFFWTQYSTIGDAIGAFIKDFPNARQRAIELDQKITSDALSISQDYADLVSLSVRQTMAGIDITISNGTDGQWNTSDVMIFMKSIDDSSRTNPTEFMFAAFPAYLYLNATWAGFLLRPSLQQQAAALPASPYAMPDLGSTYPIALGNTSTAGTEALAIESSGDMIIMALAHAKISGDGSLISRYVSYARVNTMDIQPCFQVTLLKSWANYLAANALNQTIFISSDGQNNPNLAIKGIIGVRAMGEISQIVGQTDDASQFKDRASTMLQDWENRTIPANHITSTYGQSASWGLIYNLFSDRLLKLDFIAQKIYSDQTAFYAHKYLQYGIAYDSNVLDQVKSQWTMLTAATTTDNSTRDDIVSLVRSRAWLNNSTLEFPTDYNAMSGLATGTGGRSSPAREQLKFQRIDVAPGLPLTYSLPNQSVQASAPNITGSENSKRTGSKRNVGAIIGGTLAGVVIVGLAGLFLLWKCRQKRKAQTPIPSLDPFYPHSDVPAAGNPSNLYPLRKGDRSFHSQYIGQPAVGSPTPDILVPQRRRSSLQQHSLSSTSGPAMRPRLAQRTRLEDEVENLRREMEEIRAQRIYSDEAPPQYQ
ncbi:hypothetical protein BD779DRAFT_1678882 [Infundibulicybe gibba]|nr:hypothetical protein BD779DRAFT_1678882 [Infundibulicybe gibba]